MIAPIYGSLPVAHDTGGIHDTIKHLVWTENTGNGFKFENFDASGLFWAIEQAMLFIKQPEDIKAEQIERIMKDSADAFTYANTARNYIDLYEKMLQRPLIADRVPDTCRDSNNREA
jgi:starch synthase/alpha-amylase